MSNIDNIKVFFDTETTGTNLDSDRIIEVCLIELINDEKIGKIYHQLVNPDGKEINPEAFEVHGISLESLHDKPKFKEIMPDIIDFIKGKQVVAHNVIFDRNFLNKEFKLAGCEEDIKDIIDSSKDTLDMAKKLYPGKRVSLDKVLDYCGIDRTEREKQKHNALLDTKLLIAAYLEMNKVLKEYNYDNIEEDRERKPIKYFSLPNIVLTKVSISSEEEEAHKKLLEDIGSDFSEKKTNNLSQHKKIKI